MKLIPSLLLLSFVTLVGGAFPFLDRLNNIADNIRGRRKSTSTHRVPFLFVKTHKTGSTTVAAVLRTTASRRGYKCFVPPVALASHIWSWEAPLYRHILEEEITVRGKFDCWAVHSTLSMDLALHGLAPNPLIVISLRDPLARIISAYFHYRPGQRHLDSFFGGNMSASFEAWIEESTWSYGHNVTREGWFKSTRDALTNPGSRNLCEIESPQLGFNGMSSQLLPYFFRGKEEACFEQLAEMSEAVRRGEVATVVLEQLDLSLVLLQRRLGWYNTPRKNRSISSFFSRHQRKASPETFHDMAYFTLNEGTSSRGGTCGEKSIKTYDCDQVPEPPSCAEEQQKVRRGIGLELSESTKLKAGLLSWRDNMLYDNSVMYLKAASESCWKSPQGQMKRISKKWNNKRQKNEALSSVKNRLWGDGSGTGHYSPACQLMARIGHDRDAAMRRLDEIRAGLPSAKARARAASDVKPTSDQASGEDTVSVFFIHCHWSLSATEKKVGSMASASADIHALVEGRGALLQACEDLKFNRTRLATQDELLRIRCKELNWDDKTWAHQRRREIERYQTPDQNNTNNQLGTALAAAASSSLPLRAICESQKAIEGVENQLEMRPSFGNWNRTHCEVAHYTKPHGIFEIDDDTIPLAFIPALLSDLDNGCEPLPTPQNQSASSSVELKLSLVVRRGGCSFTRKAALAQAQGFSTLIIVDAEHAQAHSEIASQSARVLQAALEDEEESSRTDTRKTPELEAAVQAVKAAFKEAPPLLPPMIVGDAGDDIVGKKINISIPVVMVGYNNQFNADTSVQNLISWLSSTNSILNSKPVVLRVALHRESIGAAGDVTRSFGDLDPEAQLRLVENLKFSDHVP